MIIEIELIICRFDALRSQNARKQQKIVKEYFELNLLSNVSLLFQEMQSQMNMLNPKQNLPEMSELLTSWLGGGTTTKKTTKPKSSRPGRRN